MDKNAQIEQKYPNGVWVDGLYMVDGTLKAIRFQEYNKTLYAAKVDSEGFYVPPYVKRIEIEDDSFNFWNTVSQWIMTDSVEYFSLDGFYIYGFEYFAIVKQNNGEVIFESHRFVDPDGLGKIDWQERLETLLDKLHADPKTFYVNCEKGMYRDRVKKAIDEKVATTREHSTPCIYKRFPNLLLSYNSSLPEKNKKKKITAFCDLILTCVGLMDFATKTSILVDVSMIPEQAMFISPCSCNIPSPPLGNLLIIASRTAGFAIAEQSDVQKSWCFS